MRVEEEVGRGEAVGAVWALTAGMHDTTAHCIRDSELVRLTKVQINELYKHIYKTQKFMTLLAKPGMIKARFHM